MLGYSLNLSLTVISILTFTPLNFFNPLIGVPAHLLPFPTFRPLANLRSTSRLRGFFRIVNELIMASQTPIEDLSKEMSLLLRRDTTPEQAAHTPTASDAAEESTVSGPSSASPFACDTIPSRVKQYVPLKVATSSISGAGRGLFVLKDVAAGDLLFSIPFPALNIVSSFNFRQLIGKQVQY
jgi:hypothetical protein